MNLPFTKEDSAHGALLVISIVVIIIGAYREIIGDIPPFIHKIHSVLEPFSIPTTNDPRFFGWLLLLMTTTFMGMSLRVFIKHNEGKNIPLKKRDGIFLLVFLCIVSWLWYLLFVEIEYSLTIMGYVYFFAIMFYLSKHIRRDAEIKNERRSKQNYNKLKNKKHFYNPFGN